jgi:ankyrin repeat protein
MDLEARRSVDLWGRSALHLAAIIGKTPDVARILLKYGLLDKVHKADKFAMTPFAYLPMHTKETVTQWLFASDSRIPELTTEKLLAGVDTFGKSTLHLAASSRSVQLMGLVFEKLEQESETGEFYRQFGQDASPLRHRPGGTKHLYRPKVGRKGPAK